MTDRAWMEAAACAGVVPDVWTEPGDQAALDQARAVCRLCPVLAACREYAITHRMAEGVWGGLSEDERRPLVRRHLVAVKRRDDLVLGGQQ